ncbi:hypothetical protein K501DRAFT_330441 [Backusella circina FSU 941]|nr:hypothetical protein K501DRAFT_330441 [Backusella circina FSU 941]
MIEKKLFVFVERKKALSVAATCGLSVIEECVSLQGYKLYIVEQWYAQIYGFSQYTLLRIFLYEGYAITPKGYILLTDASKLPDDMDMVMIPNGDHDAWIQQAYVNINLKRTRCSGRNALSLSLPETSFKKEFMTLYRIAETVDFNDAVINIVCLVQIALYIFKLLDKEYIDGLLCDQTTAALKQFYDFYNPINKSIEYTLKEIWLEPHLLASVISKLIICRNKLQETNHTMIKDPFIEYDTFRIHIGDYQRHKGIPYTKFIDLETLKHLNLHVPSHSKVSRVLKSTLDDISGTTNFSLQEEVSDPEYFRYHATIESLRMIWRPKLKSKSKLAGTLFTKVTTSLPWTVEPKKTSSNINESRLSFGQSSASDSGGNSSITSAFASVPNNSDSNISSLDEDIGGTKESPILDETDVTTHSATPSHTKTPSLDITRPLTRTLRHSASANDTHRLIIDDTISSITKPLLVAKDNNNPSTLDSKDQQQNEENKEEEEEEEEPTNSTSTLQPKIKIDTETYIAYQRLIQQQITVKDQLEQVKALADDFQQMANHLYEVHTRDAHKISKMERQSLEFQQLQESVQGGLYNVEERGLKLVYELEGTNSKLKEIEENVSRFYKSVNELERNFDKSQKWFTTVMLMGNFFEYCWSRIKEWKIFDREA